MTFTHAKVKLKFWAIGPRLPESGIPLVGCFDEAIRAPRLRKAYERAGIEEVGGPLLGYRRGREENTASMSLEVWVYGKAINAPGIARIFLDAINDESVLISLRERAESDRSSSWGEWLVERITGPRGEGKPLAGPTDFRVGVHGQKHKHRIVDTSSPVTLIRGFAVSELVVDTGGPTVRSFAVGES